MAHNLTKSPPEGPVGRGGARKPIFCRCVRRILTRVLYAYLQHYLSFCSCVRRKNIRWCAGDTLLKISLPTHPHLGLFVGRPPMGVFAVGLQSASQFPFVWARCVTEEKPKMSAFSAWPGGGPGGLPPGIFFRCVRRKCN